MALAGARRADQRHHRRRPLRPGLHQGQRLGIAIGLEKVVARQAFRQSQIERHLARPGTERFGTHHQSLVDAATSARGTPV